MSSFSVKTHSLFQREIDANLQFRLVKKWFSFKNYTFPANSVFVRLIKRKSILYRLSCSGIV